MYLDTELPGDPLSFDAAATYLRRELGGGADALASQVYAERTSLGAAWQGEGGEGFQRGATGLAKAADSLAGHAEIAAAELEALGSVLSSAQLGLLAVRTEAVAAGLFSTGALVHSPIRR